MPYGIIKRWPGATGRVAEENVMPSLGVPELLIILVIVIVLFGASRLAGIGSAVGSSIREFKKSVRDDDPAVPPSTTTRGDDVSDASRR